MSSLAAKAAIGGTAAAAAAVVLFSHIWLARRQARRKGRGQVFHNPSDIPEGVISSLDVVIVLGGGVPLSVDEPPIYVQRRCDDAAEIVSLHYAGEKNAFHDDKQKARPQLPILALSAGTAHLPQLMSDDGLPIWESTASAAYLQTRHGMDKNIHVETTSYDTIGNAFYARTCHTNVNGWRRLLIVTNEFHMDRTKAIFDWIFGIDNAGYELYYLASVNVGLSTKGLEARRKHEERGAKTVQEYLAPQYKTLKDVWSFVNRKHDLYTATKLVDRARNANSNTLSSDSNKEQPPSASFKESYGGSTK